MTTTDCDYQLIITEELTELVIEAPVVAFLEVEATGLPGVDGKDAPGLVPMSFGRFGEQYVKMGDAEFTIEYPATLLGLRAKLVDAPVGQDFRVALRKNGSVIQHATIPDGQKNSGYTLISDVVGACVPDDYVTLDVEQVGTTTPGTSLTVTLWMKVAV